MSFLKTEFLLFLIRFSLQNTNWTQSHLTTFTVTTVCRAAFVSLLNCCRLITYPVSSPSPTQQPRGNFKVSIILHFIINRSKLSPWFSNILNQIIISNPCCHHLAVVYYFNLMSYYCTTCYLPYYILPFVQCPSYISLHA